MVLKKRAKRRKKESMTKLEKELETKSLKKEQKLFGLMNNHWLFKYISYLDCLFKSL